LWNGDTSLKLMWLNGEEWGGLSTEFILSHISHDEISLAKANQAKRKKNNKGTDFVVVELCFMCCSAL